MEKKFCCKTMDIQINHECEQHSDPFECGDYLVIYIPKFDEYGIIIHDGGSSFSVIQYCPWCGTKLPESRRDEWFDKLESLGFADPSEQDIPKEFQSSEWYEQA